MSAFSAVIAIRRYISDYPNVSALAAIESILHTDADLKANDFETGLELHNKLPTDISFMTPAIGIQNGLRSLIEETNPWWIKGLPYGRERLLALLNQDEAQCFRSAGLFETPPSSEVVKWWDELAQKVRANENDKLLSQGREAEELSLEHERKRLESIGIALEPRWIAIENNGAGYDIHSYDRGDEAPANRLIEVKSSKQNPPRMFLTRNEWEAAFRFGSKYHFHVWKLPEKRLIEISVDTMALHIPTDRGLGKWSEIEIKFLDEKSED